ncbi:3'-5' exonuclease [Microbulbifer spongiae]|uniref:DNA-directed DNA polymerase n=1 Tax=Microbulbifer spongiae TaxID=2944933 RepID=A0ABY9EAY5_9GAMM|nr:3'-5' exonuclease [Microbulbifer sp. MI-G]WKD49526.1 3'-5' exonuclease [Microbulbifer sp. MI-G]
MKKNNADTVVVLDFETSGLSPDMGDRAIEIGAVLIEEGKITDRFQQLMNPGFKINSFIQQYTGITNSMLHNADIGSVVIKKFAKFIGKNNLVAHNAAFDRRFLDSEMAIAQKAYSGQFNCSMLLARRIYQNAQDHKLETLVRLKKLPISGTFHRALADTEMTAHLWLKMLEDLEVEYGVMKPSFEYINKLSKTPKHKVAILLRP